MQYFAVILFLNHTILSGKKVCRTYSPVSTQFHLLAVLSSYPSSLVFKLFTVLNLPLCSAMVLSHSLKREKQIYFVKVQDRISFET